MSIAARLARTQLRRGAFGVQAVSNEPGVNFAQYRDDPIGFCREFLRVRNTQGELVPFEPWDDGSGHSQAEIFRAVGRASAGTGKKRITTRSGHKVGKSTSAGALGWWWVTTRIDEEPRVLLTAPTAAQVDKAIWREFKLFHQRATVKLPGTPFESASTGWKGPGGAELFGRVARNADAISGPGGARLLVFVDEAAGIDDEIASAIEGMAAAGGVVVYYGNPSQTSGPFFDSHHSTDRWERFHIDSRAVAKLKIPGLASEEWIEGMIREWGPDDPRTQFRIYGDFPTGGEFEVIPLAMVQTAVKRPRSNPGRHVPIEIGLDPARFGTDKSIAIVKQGRRIREEIGRWSKRDSKALANEVRLFARNLRREYGLPKTRVIVRVDSIGIGSGVYDQLVEFDDELDVIAVDVSTRADESHEYVNLRANLWFDLRAQIKDDLELPNVPGLIDDLKVVRYFFERKTNRIQIEDKEELRKRIKRSPDYGDACALAAYPARGRTGERVYIPNL